ncbi:MAG: 50S ribosomal protein L29 [Candidatus Hydrothermarchaeales archaeon]
MAILRSEEIRELTQDEMQDKVFELRNELLRERSKVASGGVPENPGRIKEIKRTIARILTIENLKDKEVVKQEQKSVKEERSK